jgi:hypothetical protein
MIPCFDVRGCRVGCRRATLRLRYSLTGTMLRAVAAVIPLLPRRVVMGIGSVMGTAYSLMAGDCRVGEANLDIVFGASKPPADKWRVLMSACRNLALNLVGLLWGPRLTARNVHR